MHSARIRGDYTGIFLQHHHVVVAHWFYEADIVAELNVQNQQRIVWPRNLTVAKAYVDQLERSNALPADRITALRDGIAKAETNKKAGDLKKLAAATDRSTRDSKNTTDAARLAALAEILKNPAF